MFDCSHLDHPFLHDPGTAQADRALPVLLPENVPVDGRKMADLLNYFLQLARQINYYDEALNISDWTPFFSGSLPFVLSAIAATPLAVQEQKRSFYARQLQQHTSEAGLQLAICYSYYTALRPLQQWAAQLQGSGAELEPALNSLIKEKLQQPLKSVISWVNTASHCFGTRKIDFSAFLNQPAWGLETADLYAYEGSFTCSTGGNRAQILAAWESISAAIPFFTAVMGQISATAAGAVNQSLVKLLTLDGKSDTSPHLALLYSFLQLFAKLQTDLNQYTRYHLSYFYTKVLRLAPAPAVPDKAHIVFEIQQQLQQYLLTPGLLVKDGKDNNKADILFGLDEPLVVNHAAITDIRTLFVNNQYHYDKSYIEGVYAAPDAGMADGINKPFDDPATASWPTLGSDYSKYRSTGSQQLRPYPQAILGFILHSPVLLLSEGTRTVTITLACNYVPDICPEQDPAFELTMSDLMTGLQTVLGQAYYYFDRDILPAAVVKGLDPALQQKLTDNFLTETVNDCYGKHSEDIYRTSVPEATLTGLLDSHGNPVFTAVEISAINFFFPLRKLFQLQFSGAKGWVSPLQLPSFILTPSDTVATEFSLQIKAVLDPSLPAITFYDKKVLGTDYQTTDPLIKIQLDDSIKIAFTSLEPKPDCCLEPVAPTNELKVSTYHFFKHVRIIDSTSIDDPAHPGHPLEQDTSIVTDVCGMKNVILQNDQNTMDVNSPVYPFGTRPTIIDFNKVQPDPLAAGTTPNLVGPNFYIGSAEIFCKAWTAVWIGINWKDKPSSFNEYYAAYYHNGALAPPHNYGLDEDGFEVNLAVLDNGNWVKEFTNPPLPAIPPPPVASGYAQQNLTTMDYNRKLFDKETDKINPVVCDMDKDYAYSFYVTPDAFAVDPVFRPFPDKLAKYTTDSRVGFIRFTLENQDFMHKNYSFVLARQMVAFGKLPDTIVDDAVYYDAALNQYFVVDTATLVSDYNNLVNVANRINTEADFLFLASLAGGGGNPIPMPESDNMRNEIINPIPVPPTGLLPDAGELNATVTSGVADLAKHAKPAAVIPKEPWTPIISNLMIHYSAKASINDMGIIHLYPYVGTYMTVDISQQPTLLPTYCRQGNLFLGLQKLLPGENLNILFEFAEATADSEDAPDRIHWEYLAANQLLPLAPDSQVIEDASWNLTRSGIVELSIPKEIDSNNTVMPAGLFWLKASVTAHSAGVSETRKIFTQAMQVTFIPATANAATGAAASDLNRLATPLPAGSLSKLNTIDGAVTKVQQPFPSFGGRVPEGQGRPFFQRISELLRHRGRGIQKWDYERLVLQAFPQVGRAKCINHSYFLNAHQYKYDFPMAPGNVILALVPDVQQLEAGDSLQPKLPLALLEEVQAFLQGLISPFIQLFVVNPRYEPIDFCLQVILVKGMDPVFYSQQLRTDLIRYLAPWLTGELDRYKFGQPVFRSDIVRFLEGLYYIDYLADLQMTHQGDPMPVLPLQEVEPLTPRSILIAGEIVVGILQPTGPGPYPEPPCGNPAIPVIDYCHPVKLT